MFNIGSFLGALGITFLISRLFLWLLKKWNGGVIRLFVAHGTTLALAWTLSAFGHADGGPLRWDAGVIYAFAQTVWLVLDVIKMKRSPQSTTPH